MSPIANDGLQTEVKRIRSATREVKGSGHLRAIVAHTSRVDGQGDIVRPGATSPTDISLAAWNHSGFLTLPPGRGRVFERNGHVELEAEFFDTISGREHRQTLIGLGSLTEYSVEYLVTRRGQLSDSEIAAGAVRAIEGWELLAVSPVLKGAMPDTETLEIKCEGCGCDRASRHGVAKDAPAEAARTEAARFAALSERSAIPASVPLATRFAPAVEFARERFALYPSQAPAIKVVAPGAIRDGGTGLYDVAKNEIWIRAGLSDQEVRAVIFHEHCHAYERAKGWAPDEAFAESMERRLVGEWNR
jgi:hypothetical protein